MIKTTIQNNVPDMNPKYSLADEIVRDELFTNYVNDKRESKIRKKDQTKEIKFLKHEASFQIFCEHVPIRPQKTTELSVRETENQRYQPIGPNSKKLLRILPKKATIQIYYIFKASLDLDHFPKQWKVVIPI